MIARFRRGRPVPAILLSTLLLAMLTTAGSANAQSAGASPEPYRLHPGDVLLINVLEDPELDRQTLILPDGRISLPVAGTIVAAGQTPAGLERTIQRRLRRNFVKLPTVTVGVVSLADPEDDEDALREVFVLGEVGTPGRFEYDSEKPITVLKALSLAGGLGPFAARSRIQVRETVDGAETVQLFDYDAIEQGAGVSLKGLTALQDGTVIIVPERGLLE